MLYRKLIAYCLVVSGSALGMQSYHQSASNVKCLQFFSQVITDNYIQKLPQLSCSRQERIWRLKRALLVYQRMGLRDPLMRELSQAPCPQLGGQGNKKKR